VTVSVKRLVRRGARVDLSGTRAFAGDGFAGTVHSTLVLTTGGRSGGGSSSAGIPAPGPKTVPIRTVSEPLKVVSTSGQLSAAVRGTSDPYECRLLDSCGLTGTLTAALAPAHPQASLVAYGSAKRPYRDFLAALGVDSKGNPRGISFYGSIAWAGGSFAETIDQGGRCSDTGPIVGAFISFARVRSGLLAAFQTPASLRTHCPGPFFSEGGQTLASGSIGLNDLRHRTFTLRLGGASSFTDQGYSIVSHTRLSFVLRRGRVSQQGGTAPTIVVSST
jgi:hypothetical protein